MGTSTVKLKMYPRTDTGMYFVQITMKVVGGKSRTKRISLGTKIKREAERRVLLIEQDAPEQFFVASKDRDMRIDDFIGNRGDDIEVGKYSMWAAKRFTRKSRESQIEYFPKVHLYP